jgi:energy-coupling factor transporter ATP-binding protein EcfA2
MRGPPTHLPCKIGQLEAEAVKTFERRFLFVTGKGGVGKTTVAASLARALSLRGRRVLLAATDSTPYRELLPDARWEDDPAPSGERSFTVRLEAEAALREYGRLLIKPRLARQALFENRYVQGFLAALPGLPQWAVLGKAWFHSAETERGVPRFDSVVFDAPATGHGLELLRLPRTITELAPAGLLRRDAELAWQMFQDTSQCCICLVTLPEELPTNETIELCTRIRGELGLPLGALVLNRTLTPAFSSEQRERLAPLAGLQPQGAGETALRAAALRAVAERVQHESVQRLTAVGAPLVLLPEVETARAETLLDQLASALTNARPAAPAPAGTPPANVGATPGPSRGT